MEPNGASTDWSIKDVFTTGEAAEICRVSQQTIIRCFDSGRLTGFRVPGSKFRRIPRDELIRFMRANNIPTEIIGGGPACRMLIVSSGIRLQEQVRAAIDADGSMRDRVDLLTATSALEAGLEIASKSPSVICIAGDVPGMDLAVATRMLSARSDRPDIVCITATTPELSASALRHAGASFVTGPLDRSESVVAAVLSAVRSRLTQSGQ
ncbi:MAG TPA: helix-turn-helix domain-containing protein [Phycisphaerales bacterium]|nr:helix-turn-helix domain-containing protein [Phycisphaerales bacterium]